MSSTFSLASRPYPRTVRQEFPPVVRHEEISLDPAHQNGEGNPSLVFSYRSTEKIDLIAQVFQVGLIASSLQLVEMRYTPEGVVGIGIEIVPLDVREALQVSSDERRSVERELRDTCLQCAVDRSHELLSRTISLLVPPGEERRIAKNEPLIA